jgi:hypothetical protein
MTVISTLVTRLGFDYDPKGIKRHDADVKQSTATLAKSERQGSSWGKTLGSAGKMAAAGLAVFAGAAVAAGTVAARWAAAAVTDFAKVGDEIAKTSGKLGVTTDELQRMRFAAGRSGASSESLAVAIKTLNRQMFDASKTGKGPLVDALSEIGLSVKDLEGLTTEQRFGLIANALNKIEDPARKSAIAMKVFGEQGTALIPMLNEGSAGLARLYATAQRQPDFLSPQQLKDAERLNDALGDLKGSVKGASNQIAAALAPTVGAMATDLAAWIRENDKLIKQDIPALLGYVADGLRAMGKQLDVAIDEWRFLIKEGELWAAWAEEKIPGIGQMMNDVFTALANPIETVGDLVGNVVSRIDSMAESLGVIDSKARGLGSWLGLTGNEPRTNVRGVGFLNESEETRVKRMEALPPASLAALLVDPSTAPDDKRAASIAISESTRRTGRYKQQVDAFAMSAAALGSKAQGMLAAAGASFAPKVAPERRKGRGGRGAGAKKEATETGPSIDELINSLGEDGVSMRDALDAARSGMPTGRQTPLAGAQIVRIDASFNATTNVSIELPPGVVSEGVGAVIDEAEKRLSERLRERDRQAFAHYEAAVSV